MNGFEPLLAASAFNEIAGIAPSPTFIVLFANTSCAKRISVATELNVAPNDSQYIAGVPVIPPPPNGS